MCKFVSVCIVCMSDINNPVEHHSFVDPRLLQIPVKKLHTCYYYVPIQIQWIGWMDRCVELSVDATMRYSDIIVPTLDTIRCSFLIELLLTNNKKVVFYPTIVQCL